MCDGETPGEEAALAIAQALAQRLAPGQAAAAVQALSELPLPPAALALPKALRSAGCLYAPAPGGGGAILVFRPGELPAARWSAPARPAPPSPPRAEATRRGGLTSLLTAGAAGRGGRRAGWRGRSTAAMARCTRAWRSPRCSSRPRPARGSPAALAAGAALAVFVGDMLSEAAARPLSAAVLDDTGGMVVWSTRLDGTIEHWGRVAEALTGIEAKAAEGRHLAQVVLQPTKEGLERLLAQVAAAGGAPQSADLTVTTHRRGVAREEMHADLSGVAQGNLRDGRCEGDRVRHVRRPPAPRVLLHATAASCATLCTCSRSRRGCTPTL